MIPLTIAPALNLAVDAYGMPVRILITKDTRAGCKEAVHLIEGTSAQVLRAGRGYDTIAAPALWAAIHS